MSTINDITHTSIVSSASQSTTTDSSKTNSTSSDSTTSSTKKTSDIMGKQDFLTLLVTQLKNQDPLNPDDPTEFTAQLAQFSSLEQLYNLNESMTGLTTSTDNTTKLSALSLIGKQVTYTGSSFSYNGNPVKLGYTLDGPASEVQLIVQDSTGKTLRTLSGTELTKGNHPLTWDGYDEDGNKMEAGTYNVVIQAKGVDSTGVAASPFITSEVTGIDMSSSSTSPTVNTKTGDVLFSKILGVLSLGTSSTSATSTTTTDQTSLSQTAASTAADAAAAAATAAVNTIL
jgi:flagellar basal-body rod modification protein FlgD